MKPTAGDIRCIALGHITRMAIWRLRPAWDAAVGTEAKLSIFREKMNAIATVDEVNAGLESVETPQPRMLGGLFAQQDTRGPLDAVAF